MLQEGHKLSLNLKISIHPAWSIIVRLSCSIWLLSATPDAPLQLFSSLSCFAPETASKPAPLHGFTPHSLFAPLSSAFSYFLVFTFPGPTSEELPQQPWRPGVTHSCCLPRWLCETKNLRKAELPKPEPLLELWLIPEGITQFNKTFTNATQNKMYVEGKKQPEEITCFLIT